MLAGLALDLIHGRMASHSSSAAGARPYPHPAPHHVPTVAHAPTPNASEQARQHPSSSAQPNPKPLGAPTPHTSEPVARLSHHSAHATPQPPPPIPMPSLAQPHHVAPPLPPPLPPSTPALAAATPTLSDLRSPGSLDVSASPRQSALRAAVLRLLTAAPSAGLQERDVLHALKSDPSLLSACRSDASQGGGEDCAGVETNAADGHSLEASVRGALATLTDLMAIYVDKHGHFHPL